VEQQKIKFNYVLTPEDLREGFAPARASKPLWRRILTLLSWVIILSCWLFGWMISRLTVGIPQAVHPIVPRPEIDDLWLVLLPTLVPVSLILYGYIVTLIKGAMTTEFADPAAISKRAKILSSITSAVWLLVVVASVWIMSHPELAWPWTPTRLEILLLSFGPWAALFLALALLSPLKRRMAVRTLWNTTPTVRRAKAVEIDWEGMVVVDAKFSSRYRWSFFVRYSETNNLLRLHMEDRRIFMIPKRAVPSDQMIPLRALIHEKIAQGKFLISETGFQVVTPQPVIPISDEEIRPSGSPPN
jgi:hypothetical protein